MPRLDPDELEVLEALEAGGLAQVADKAEMQRLWEGARATLLGDRALSLAGGWPKRRVLPYIGA